MSYRQPFKPLPRGPFNQGISFQYNAQPPPQQHQINSYALNMRQEMPARQQYIQPSVGVVGPPTLTKKSKENIVPMAYNQASKQYPGPTNSRLPSHHKNHELMQSPISNAPKNMAVVMPHQSRSPLQPSCLGQSNVYAQNINTAMGNYNAKKPQVGVTNFVTVARNENRAPRQSHQNHQMLGVGVPTARSSVPVSQLTERPIQQLKNNNNIPNYTAVKPPAQNTIPSSMTHSLIAHKPHSTLLAETANTFTPQVKQSFAFQSKTLLINHESLLRSAESISNESSSVGSSRFSNQISSGFQHSGRTHGFQPQTSTSDFGYSVAGFQDGKARSCRNSEQEEIYSNIDLKFNILAEKLRQVEGLVDQVEQDKRQHIAAIQSARNRTCFNSGMASPLIGTEKVLKKSYSTAINLGQQVRPHHTLSFTEEKLRADRSLVGGTFFAINSNNKNTTVAKRLDFEEAVQPKQTPVITMSTLDSLALEAIAVSSANNSCVSTQRSYDERIQRSGGVTPLNDSNNSVFKKKLPNPATVIHQDSQSLSQPIHPQQMQVQPLQQTSNQTVLPSSIKLDDFVKGKLLGKGKFGEVFVVKHKILGFACAMKVVSKAVVKEQKMETQIIRQLKIACHLSHPNVMRTYGFFDDQDNIYILMELCTGGNLYKLIQKHRRLGEEDTAYLVKQVCEGVRYLHSLRVLHRDLKPENIVVQNGIVKICDFGWAVFAGQDGMRSTVCGTPLYLSPQIVKGDQYDDRTDLWAIGILTYELLIGRIPFRIWTEEQLTKIVSDEVTFPDYVQVSGNAKNFILSILEKDPNKRIFIENMADHPFLREVDQIRHKLSFG